VGGGGPAAARAPGGARLLTGDGWSMAATGARNRRLQEVGGRHLVGTCGMAGGVGGVK
jgi:hypothetical protein